MLTVFMFQMSSPSTIAMCSFRSKGEGDEKDEKVEVPQPELFAQNYSLCWRDRLFHYKVFTSGGSVACFGSIDYT